MARKFALNVVVMVSALVFSGAAYAETTKGICEITAAVHGGKKFVTLKCAKASDPGDFKIRSTVWEKDDRAAYGKMARFAGRRFACDLTRGGTTRDTNIETTHYELSKCH